MKKTTAAIIGVFLLVLPASAFKMPEATDGKLRVKALNPEFVRNRLEAKAGRIVHFSRQGHPLGFIPSPVNLSKVRLPKGLNANAVYPARYDLRTMNKLTPVKDQGSCGSCWAFSTTASMESFLMPGEEKNFSEQNLNAHHGFDNAECEGGNSWMAAAYFTRWDGPVLESDDPYPYYKAADLTVRKHIQQALLLPARNTCLENSAVKYLLTQFGAVEASFAYDDDYYSFAHSSYYCTSDDECNHSVTIVGWDDDYPASNFRTTAPGNGAFIVKNSWGTSWGDDGFFYLSYYDKSLDTMSCFNNAEPVINYQRIYQYDPLGWTTNVGIITDAGSAANTRAASTTGWGANLFTAQNNLSLRAVGFYTTDMNVKYEIRVYKNVQAGRPRSGTLAASQSGSKVYPGFYTVALNTAVALGNGERFSVVIRFVNSTDPYPVPVEMPIPDYSSNASANAGESFISPDGMSWEDVSASLEETNVCIKAYTAADSVALTLQASAHGTTDPVPAVYRIPRNSELSVLAVPDLHAAFTGWTGASTGTQNPVTITVEDAPKTIKANFQVILGPSGASGTRVLNRSLSQAEYINVLSWQANPGNQGLNVTGYRIYLQGTSATLLEEVAATQLQYRHRQAGKDAAVYTVTAVTSDGREGEASLISIPKE